jgi:hypothetical protein
VKDLAVDLFARLRERKVLRASAQNDNRFGELQSLLSAEGCSADRQKKYCITIYSFSNTSQSHPILSIEDFTREGETMLWTIFAILLILWLLGFSFHVAGGLIHLLLVVAVIVLIVNLITGRSSAV